MWKEVKELRFCPDCGGTMFYDRETRQYVCNSCGVSYTIQELVMIKEKKMSLKEEQERKKRQKEEYLEWWLSKKK
ncbi:MAG: FYDLN acid domain-containing protein [Nitrososphaerota archaeon]